MNSANRQVSWPEAQAAAAKTLLEDEFGREPDRLTPRDREEIREVFSDIGALPPQ
jgi:hypothetical protein